MSFMIHHPCPHCGAAAETRLQSFFGEGQTESHRYCVSCQKHYSLFASFSTAIVDQSLIRTPEFQASGSCVNFEKAQPQREFNKRTRMWRTIAATSKHLTQVLSTVASEFSSSAVLANEVLSLVKEMREELKAKGVLLNGHSEKGKPGITSKTTPGEADPVWLSEVGGGS